MWNRFLKNHWSGLSNIPFIVVIVGIFTNWFGLESPPKGSPPPYHPTAEFYEGLCLLLVGMIVVAMVVCLIVDAIRNVFELKPRHSGKPSEHPVDR